MKLTTEELQQIIKEELESVIDEKASKRARRKKRQKRRKKKAKRDACYHKVKRRYKVWPSAYASGALVKCRKVGAKNWGNKSKKNESLNESKDEFKPHMMYDPKSDKKEKANKVEDHERLAKKGYTHVDPAEIIKIIGKGEGGAAGLPAFVKKFGKEMKDEIIKTLEAMPDIGQHENGDYVMSDKKQIRVVKEVKKNCGCGKDPCKTFGNLTEAEFKERYDHRHMSEATYEDGSLVEEGFSFVEPMNEDELEEAVYAGKTVKLNKPMRGDVKKFKVYVNSGKKDKKGRIKAKKVNFGHGGSSARKKGEKTMRIRKSNPKARRNFRKRHNCANPGPKTKARYWSCRKW